MLLLSRKNNYFINTKLTIDIFPPVRLFPLNISQKSQTGTKITGERTMTNTRILQQSKQFLIGMSD